MGIVIAPSVIERNTEGKMKHALLILTFIFSFTISKVAGQTVFATTQTNGANGFCVGCHVSDPQNCVSPSTTDFSTINLTVGATGAQVWLVMKFPSSVAAGTSVYAIVEDQNGQVLTPLLMASVRLTSYMGGTDNDDTQHSNQYSIQPYSGSQYIIGFTPTVTFDALEVRMVGGVAGALNALRVYAAFYGVAPLPIELTYFNASPGGTDVIVEWATATETNNDHFTIERSKDGTEFLPVGVVKGAGTSSSAIAYSYEDKNVGAGTWYYRLRQTDHNGECSYSKIAAVQLAGGLAGMGLYPNPCTDHTFYIDMFDEDVDVEVLTMGGDKLFGKRIPAGSSNAVSLPDELQEGIYIVLVTSSHNTSMKKLVVK
jgi:hypothetical protein